MTPTCSQCEGKLLAKGLCRKHYLRQRKHGDVTVVKNAWSSRKREGYEEGFRKRVGPITNSGCRLWQGSTDGDFGYGRWRHRPAHVVAWELANGSLLEGQQVNHGPCDNPLCVEPTHLYAGTQRDNMHDRLARGRYRNQFGPRRVDR